MCGAERFENNTTIFAKRYSINLLSNLTDVIGTEISLVRFLGNI